MNGNGCIVQIHFKNIQCKFVYLNENETLENINNIEVLFH